MENGKYYLKTKIMKISKDELKENVLSLGNFIDYFDINLIPYDPINLNDYEYYFIQNYNKNQIIEFYENNISNCYNIDIDNLKDYDENDLNQMIKNDYYDFLYYYGIDYFQYFIINENDLFLFEDYCNYDILYNYEKDLYILCIDHLGLSWYMINTKYSLDNLMDNYIFNSTNDIYKLFEKK